MQRRILCRSSTPCDVSPPPVRAGLFGCRWLSSGARLAAVFLRIVRVNMSRLNWTKADCRRGCMCVWNVRKRRLPVALSNTPRRYLQR